jgi:hypothetical protein
MLTKPVARLNMIDALVAGIPKGSSLLGRKVSPLSFSDPVQLFLSLVRRLHNRSTFSTYYEARGNPGQVPPGIRLFLAEVEFTLRSLT